jgi:hypothetical protein
MMRREIIVVLAHRVSKNVVSHLYNIIIFFIIIIILLLLSLLLLSLIMINFCSAPLLLVGYCYHRTFESGIVKLQRRDSQLSRDYYYEEVYVFFMLVELLIYPAYIVKILGFFCRIAQF